MRDQQTHQHMTRMTCDQFALVVGEVVDGEGTEPTRVAATAHALECVPCGSLFADLRRIRDDAAALPPLLPSRDLWSEIAERIDTPVIPMTEYAALATPPSGWSRRWGSRSALAWGAGGIAAALLIALTASLTYVVTIATRHPGTTVASHSAASDARTLPSGERARVVLASGAPEAGVELAYDEEIAGLRASVAQRKTTLDPATTALINRNLAIIDSAITQCRTALARDPSSRYLVESLTNAYESKIGLLRTAATLPAAE